MSNQFGSGGTLVQRGAKIPKNARFRVHARGRSTLKSLDLDFEVAVVGSDPSCDLHIVGDRCVSGRHIKLRKCSGGIEVVHLSKTNPTFMSVPVFWDPTQASQITDTCIWLPGLSLHIGETELTLELVVDPDPEAGHFFGIVGTCERMLFVYERIRNYAVAGFPVYLHGETGTGKELAARAIHVLSPRYEGPIVAINCAGLSEELAWSELFGHVKGAFTGAVSDFIGAFKRADGGTLFLDEFAELSPKIQAMLLRAIQEGEIEPRGGKVIKVNVRVVVATNADLRAMVKQRRFREDLYYRVCNSRIDLPALAERGGDLPALVAHLFPRIPGAAGKKLSAEANKKILAYRWPGNIRQLKAKLEQAVANSGKRAVIEASDVELDDEDEYEDKDEVPPVNGVDTPYLLNLDAKTQEQCDAHIAWAAIQREGSERKAAKALGISRETLAKRAKKP